MIGTKFNLIDQSSINKVATNPVEIDNSPVVLAAFSSAKGTEEWFDLKGLNYNKMFGSPSFKNYGQVSIQNQRIIDAGARIVGKRLVADDATLANIIISGKLYKTEVQKVDADNKPLYYDAQMQESITVSENPVMIRTAHVKYEATAATGAKSVDQVVEAAGLELDNTGTIEGGTTTTVFTYPLFVFTDNGRNVSKKSVSISPDLDLSKNLSFMYHNISVYENGELLESARFAAVPDTVYHGANIELTQVANSFMTQIKARSLSDSISLFITKLAELSLIEDETLTTGDILFGTNIKGTKYTSVVIDTENGINLQAVTGISLVNGTNGTFGAGPFTTGNTAGLTAYNAKLLEFYNGTTTDKIYNVDAHQVDAIFDANLPKNVKEAITVLADYRKDFMFFRDLGLANYTIEDIKTSVTGLTKSENATTFCQAYDILDPYSLKNSKVTAIYSIAYLMVDHLKNRRNLPFAGESNEAILTDALKGTITFEASVTPNVDEKAILEDLRVNFASYFGEKLIVETLYTSQEEYTQLSFSNNVMALQRVFKALRVAFPAIRYQFISNEQDLKKVKQRVNESLSPYAADFEELIFDYIQDTTMLSNKIFRAALSFRFKEFFQAELIDAYIKGTASSVTTA